jgi:hypothetical protein
LHHNPTIGRVIRSTRSSVPETSGTFLDDVMINSEKNHFVSQVSMLQKRKTLV